MEITKIKIGSNVYDIKDNAAVTAQGVTEAVNLALYGSTTKPSGATIVTSENIATIAGNAGLGTGDGDTKNTAGATNYAGTQLFLIGAREQGANPQTYTNVNCYIGSDNSLYTNGAKVATTGYVTNEIYTELYGRNYKTTDDQVITTNNLVTALQNAGITSGITKYVQLEYTQSRVNGSGALTIDGTHPIYIVTVNANISSVALQNNPTYGHSCHIIFKSADSSSYTVAIGNDSTNRICPTSAGITLTVPAADTGYAEVDFLNTGNSIIGDEVYVRGV